MYISQRLLGRHYWSSAHKHTHTQFGRQVSTASDSVTFANKTTLGTNMRGRSLQTGGRCRSLDHTEHRRRTQHVDTMERKAPCAVQRKLKNQQQLRVVVEVEALTFHSSIQVIVFVVAFSTNSPHICYRSAVMECQNVVVITTLQNHTHTCIFTHSHKHKLTAQERERKTVRYLTGLSHTLIRLRMHIKCHHHNRTLYTECGV